LATSREIENLTYHPDETQASVLIAREGSDGYLGFWSYDERLVRNVQRPLESR
jgi:hypothetical protein